MGDETPYSAPDLAMIRAGMDRDEALARAVLAVAPAPWYYGTVESVAGGTLYDAHMTIGSVHFDVGRVDPRIRPTRTTEQADLLGAWLATQDPASVIAGVERDRQALADAEAQQDRHGPLVPGTTTWCRRCPIAPESRWPCPDRAAADAALARLAATYAPPGSGREGTP